MRRGLQARIVAARFGPVADEEVVLRLHHRDVEEEVQKLTERMLDSK